MENKMSEFDRTIRIKTCQVGNLTLYHFSGHLNRETRVDAPEASALVAMTELNKVLKTTRCREFTEVAATRANLEISEGRPILISANISGMNEWMFTYGDIMYLSKKWCSSKLPTDINNPLSQLRDGYTDCGHAGEMVSLRYFVASNYV